MMGAVTTSAPTASPHTVQKPQTWKRSLHRLSHVQATGTMDQRSWPSTARTHDVGSRSPGSELGRAHPQVRHAPGTCHTEVLSR
jgi:hypothetical protein